MVRPLLRGETVDITGEFYSARGVYLHNLQPRPDIPIVLASRGDRVLQVAGECADAAMIATYATPAGLAHGRAMVDAGAQQAGRDPSAIQLYTRIDVSLDRDGKAARDAVRPMIAAMVMASYPDQAFLHHAGLEITPELEAMARQKNEALAFASGALVPDAYVEQFAWVGTPDEVAHQIARVVDSGFRNVVVLMQPMRTDPEASMRLFASDVIPRVRALVQ
jgi:5,10-methylenetetrahydromethanopterin reductase